ncbi:LmbE family protein [Gordoniibacillus kamchatkensis]|uniref:LmbE family protein n=1 Tax=Gordoniibacillus kamchatkensis TaxID=1590651 RepID=A0ABR5ACY0_9BACL|nr:PIG-L family deacetylase [Paenibacillus sp. VKM B-2647]KIL38538.1 LmbE family protein [Paenibacillus sp. VKM B-2647]
MSENQKQHILAIGAHAGDQDLTAGAVLAKYVMAGHKVTMLHLTPGEKGHPRLSAEDYAKQKIEEAHQFADMIGADVRFLNYKDAELPSDETVKYEVADVIRELKPDIVITHWHGSMHKDHENTHYIVQDARLYAALEAIKRDLPNHRIKRLYYSENWEDMYGYQPEIFIDIPEEAFDKWVKGISCYAFARGETYGFPYIEYYKALTVVRGAVNGFKRAQAFAVGPGGNHQRLQYFM